MALKNCKECGKEVSSSAKSCPNCGKKNPTGATSLGVKIVIALFVLSAIGQLINERSEQSMTQNVRSETKPLAQPSESPGVRVFDSSSVYTSEPNAIFCTSKVFATNFQSYMLQKDVTAAASVIERGDCSFVLPSLEVFIDKASSENSTDVVGVRRKGLTTVVWTFKHMLK